MRKLVTIRTVSDIQPIPNADNIEVITVDGWKVVSKKGEFSVGDSCVYFEVDSVLPDREPFLFLTEKGKKTFYNGEVGFRLRTVKLRKQISQGLALPVDSFDASDLEGDIQENLGIWKYDPPPPAALSGMTEGYLPSWIMKTDEERVQNIDTGEFSGLFDITEKIDGSSMSVWIDPDGNIGVGSRNLSLKITPENSENSFVKMLQDSGLAEYLENHVDNGTCFQGELAGPSIQGNKLKLDKHTLFLFMELNETERKQNYATLCETHKHMIAHGVNPDMVSIAPHLGFIAPSETSTEEFILMADGKSGINNKINREGLVFRNVNDGNISFKVISNKFLLKHE